MDVFGTYAAGFADPSSARYMQTVPPSLEPVTVDDAKSQCSIFPDDTSWDDYLTGLLAKSRAVIERRIGRQFCPATWTLSLDAFPDEISLEVLPVTGVTSIVYVDYAGNTQTLPTNQYQVDLSSRNRPARIRPVWGLIWPVTRVGTYNAVVVTFTAGYPLSTTNAANAPLAAQQAILMLTAQWFKHREPTTDEVVHQVPISLDWALEAENPEVYA